MLASCCCCFLFFVPSLGVFFFFFSSRLLSIATRRRFYPRQTSGQAVVTGAIPPSPRHVPLVFVAPFSPTFGFNRVCVFGFFTLNRSFYPSTSSTTSVRADSSILSIEKIRVMWSQSHVHHFFFPARSFSSVGHLACWGGHDRLFLLVIFHYFSSFWRSRLCFCFLFDCFLSFLYSIECVCRACRV